MFQLFDIAANKPVKRRPCDTEKGANMSKRAEISCRLQNAVLRGDLPDVTHKDIIKLMLPVYPPNKGKQKAFLFDVEKCTSISSKAQIAIKQFVDNEIQNIEIREIQSL